MEVIAQPGGGYDRMLEMGEAVLCTLDGPGFRRLMLDQGLGQLMWPSRAMMRETSGGDPSFEITPYNARRPLFETVTISFEDNPPVFDPRSGPQPGAGEVGATYILFEDLRESIVAGGSRAARGRLASDYSPTR